MKHLIFDLDGTLLDSMPVWKGVGTAFLTNHGAATPENLHDVVKTLTVYQTAEYFRDHLDIKLTIEEIANEIISIIVDNYRFHIPLKPFAKEYLEKEYALGSKMCILTASENDYVIPALERLDILKYFEFIMTCSEVGYFKTESKVFELAMERLGGTKESTIVFEDALHAIKGAKSGNFTVYAIKDPVTERDSESLQRLAERYIENYQELL